MAEADLSTPRPLRIGAAVFIVLLHIAVILGLIRAFAPDFSAAVVDRVTAVLTVTITAPEPDPTSATPSPASAAPQEQGAAADAGKKAKPREVTAPESKIPLPQAPAPKASSTGAENSSGARDAGVGTGAGGPGAGTSAGGAGAGQGGGGGTKAEKIAGDINSARDYPRQGRDLRIGDHVIIALTVGTDGRASACRVIRPSRDPDADRITCELATKRFRFKPATNAAGQPEESVYGWKQRWFYPGKKMNRAL